MNPRLSNTITQSLVWFIALGFARAASAHSVEMWADTTMASTYAIGITPTTPSAVPMPKRCVWTPDDIDDSWRLAVEHAKAAFKLHRPRLSQLTKVIIVNYDVRDFHPWTGEDINARLRVYAVGEEWTLRERHWVSHARRSGTGCPKTFSNVPESNYSSKGAFLTDIEPHQSPNFGYPALRLIGLEPGKNDNVTRRAIIVHKARQGNVDLGYSLGCFMTRPKVNATLLPRIAGGHLLFVYATTPQS